MSYALDDLDLAVLYACKEVLQPLLRLHRTRVEAAQAQGQGAVRVEMLAQQVMARALYHYFGKHAVEVDKRRIDVLGESISLSMSMIAGEHNIVRDSGEVVDHSGTLPGGASGTRCTWCRKLITSGRLANLHEAAKHLGMCAKKQEAELIAPPNSSSKVN
jgi:hypothetical protein